MVGKIAPVLVVCDIKTDSIDVIPNIPNDINPAMPTWIPDGTGLVAIGYNIIPRKLGLIYCTNRSSHIFAITLDGQYCKYNIYVHSLLKMSLLTKSVLCLLRLIVSTLNFEVYFAKEI